MTIQTFKVKIGGLKYKARFVDDDEIINKNMLYAFTSFPEFLPHVRENIGKYKLHVTRAIGDKVNDHSKYRVYIEILSTHYKVWAEQ